MSRSGARRTAGFSASIPLLRPGQDLFVQRNDQSEIVNIFDLHGQHLQFFDGSRRFYADVEELDSPAMLAPWFTGVAATAGLIASGILLGPGCSTLLHVWLF